MALRVNQGFWEGSCFACTSGEGNKQAGVKQVDRTCKSELKQVLRWLRRTNDTFNFFSPFFVFLALTSVTLIIISFLICFFFRLTLPSEDLLGLTLHQLLLHTLTHSLTSWRVTQHHLGPPILFFLPLKEKNVYIFGNGEFSYVKSKVAKLCCRKERLINASLFNKSRATKY